MEIDKAIVHPKFNDETFDFDIALLKLKDSLDLAEYTPACLPARNQTFVGKTAWVYGWGRIDNYENEISDILRQTTQQIIPTEKCEKDWEQTGGINPNQLCAFASDQDACQGDSGGPLTVEEDGRHILVGAVSFGADYGCALVDIFCCTNDNLISFRKLLQSMPMCLTFEIG